MRNSAEIWCETSDINLNTLEYKTNEYLMSNGGYYKELDDVHIYVSPDLFNELARLMADMMRYSPSGNIQTTGTNLVSVWLSSGNFKIKFIPRYRNFLFVGTDNELREYEYNGVPPIFLSDRERTRIDEEFERTIIKD